MSVQDFKGMIKRCDWGKVRRIGFVAVVSAVILCYVAACMYINFVGFATFSHPDMYADSLISRYMWEQKTLFPESWVFGNQFYVIATPVVAALFYGLTGSMNNAMGLATTAMIFLQFLCLYWMLRPYLPRRYCLLGILTFVASNVIIDLWRNWEAQLLFTLASYYACYMVTVFVTFGDYVKSITHEKERRPLALVLSAALCFCTGMQSIRQTAIMILPLVSFECLRMFDWYILKRRGFAGFSFQPTLRACAYTVANILGVVYVKTLNIRHVSIYGNMGLASPDMWKENMELALEALQTIVGVGYTLEFPNGWFSAVVAAFAVVSVVAALVMILRSQKWGGVECYLVLYIISIVELLLGSVFVDFITRSRYFFLWFPAMAVAQLYLAYRLKGKLKYAYLILILLLSAGNLKYSYGWNLDLIEYRYQYASEEQTPDIQAAKWLCENGYEIVYGSYFTDTTAIAIETDGQVTAACWYNEMFEALSFVNALDLYAPEKNEKAAYYIFDYDLPEAMERAQAKGGELTCLVHFGECGLYSSDIPLMFIPE